MVGRNNYFQFKQFKIIQEKSAMKVGTDGILLGAWANVNGVQSILDIGTGTGLIALMLAQRSKANILGIEIEPEAANEAQINVSNSEWESRINVRNMSSQEFQKDCSKRFDLIVSNPPFFKNSLKSSKIERTLARHNDELPYSELIRGASKLLSELGKLAIIVPVSAYDELAQLAQDHSLFVNRKTAVKSNANKKAHRYLLEFSKIQTSTLMDDLKIYQPDISAYSEDYKKLTKAFYLKF